MLTGMAGWFRYLQFGLRLGLILLLVYKDNRAFFKIPGLSLEVTI